MSDERARRAKLLRNSPHAADRAESERIFRELRDEAHSGAAPLVLEDISEVPVIEKPRRQDPAYDAMASEWLSMRSPMHHSPLDSRFAKWFGEAERHPEAFANFAPRMMVSVTDWFVDYERLPNAIRGDDDNRPYPHHFDDWMNLALSYPIVAAALTGLRERWDELRSRRLVARHTHAIEAALERGDVNAAQNELTDIANSPHVPQAKVEELRITIEDLKKRHAEIDAWQHGLAGVPGSWQDVVRVHEVWAKGLRLVQMTGVPQEKVESVSRTRDRLKTEAAEFIQKRASAWTSLEALRGDLTALRNASRQRDALLDETWLEPIVASMVSLLERSIERAGTVDTVRRVATNAARTAALLPAQGGRRVQQALRHIAEVAAAWEAVEADELPAALPEGVVPTRYLQRLDRARQLAERVAAAESLLLAGHTAAARAAGCRDAIAMLALVLTEAPRHAVALELRDRAVARLEVVRLDELIERWDVAELRATLESAPPNDPLYASLAAALPVLEELAALRLRRSAAGDIHDVSEWWLAWHAVEAKLPARKPEALRAKLDDVKRDVVAAMHAAVRDHLDRTATLEEDRAAEVAVASFAPDMQLRDDLVALSQRSAIHAAVEEARAAGAGALAILIRDAWNSIERYLPWSGAILGEVFERAWEEGNDDALEALRDVALLGKHVRGESEQFRHWLDWLDVERTLFASATPEALRRVQTFLQRNESSARFVVRRLARVVSKWREDGDDAALVWAYRAFAELEPPLFPGADPLIALTRRSAAESGEIVRICREMPNADEAFVSDRIAELARIEGVWKRLDQLLVEVPVGQGVDPWPAPPPEVQEAKTLLAALRGVLDSIARWTRSDLRTMGADCDGVRRLLLRELASYPAAEALDGVVRRVEPVTRLYALQDYLRNACARCTSDAPQDRERLDVFVDAARYLDAIIDTLEASLPEGRHTVGVVSEEYWRDIPLLAGDVLPPDPASGLAGLRHRFAQLQENDKSFADAIAILWRDQPNVGSGGDFDPDAHRAYLAHYPNVPPASVRARRRFDDFAARAAQRVILRRSRALLPGWLQQYVDNISRGVTPW